MFCREWNFHQGLPDQRRGEERSLQVERLGFDTAEAYTKTYTMRQEYKKQNSPRMQSAINRVLTHVYSLITISCCGRYRIVYNPYSSMDLGVCILILAYGADKYDVLNRLCSGNRNKIVTFARGDIRNTKKRVESLETILALIVLFIIVTIFVTIGY